MKIIDSILLDLKIISQLQVGNKLYRNGNNLLGIQENDRFISIKRYLFGDSRYRSIEDIERVIDFAIENCQSILDSVYYNKSCKSKIENPFIKQKYDIEYNIRKNYINSLYTEMKNSIKGIKNLKETYKGDINIVSKIDLILTNITNFMENLDKETDKERL